VVLLLQDAGLSLDNIQLNLLGEARRIVLVRIRQLSVADRQTVELKLIAVVSNFEVNVADTAYEKRNYKIELLNWWYCCNSCESGN
jgi:hypothetical protein